MLWLARLFLLVPALVTGLFVSREDARFWVVTFVVALVFMATSMIASIYLPGLFSRKHK